MWENEHSNTVDGRSEGQFLGGRLGNMTEKP